MAGFIGSHLADRLVARGANVTGIDSFTHFYGREQKEANLTNLRQHREFQLIETSIQDAPWASLLANATHVFHLAAQAGVRGSWGGEFSLYTACNIEATQTLLEACASHATRIKRVVYASSSSVYGDEVDIPMREDARPDPISPYGVTKLAAEHLCHLYWTNHAVPTVSLRYFTVYGPRQRPDMAFHRFLRSMHAGQPITLYGDGEQTRDFTYVDDAVSATIEAADHGIPGQVYNIGGGAKVSMNHVIDLMSRRTQRTPTVRRETPQKGDMRDTFADISRARSELKFAPSVTLEQGIGAEYEWLLRSPSLS